MRSDRGRFFSPKWEARRIDRDIELHQRAFGTTIDWYFYDPAESVYDAVYDEGQDLGEGRRWNGPTPIPVLSANRREGPNITSEDGMYVVDTIDVRMSYEQARRVGLVPEMSRNHEQHYSDRFVYDNIVWGIRDISVTGQFEASGHDIIVRILGVQKRPDELVNDIDFKRWSLVSDDETADLRIVVGQEFTTTFEWEDAAGTGVPLDDWTAALTIVVEDNATPIVTLTSAPGGGIELAESSTISVTIDDSITATLDDYVGQTLLYSLVLTRISDPDEYATLIEDADILVVAP